MRQVALLGLSGLVVVGCAALPAPARAITLYFNTPSPTLNAWTAQSIPLTETGWRVDSYLSSTFATAQEFQWVLGHLEAVYVLTEWRTGRDDTNVDNVHFGSGPSSSFDTDNEDWYVAGPTPTTDLHGSPVPDSPLGWDGAFGNPAGSVRVGDVYFWTWIGAPDAYLGDQSGRYGETFDYDIFIRTTNNVPFPALALVAPDPPDAVPEPGTLGLLLTGLAVAGLRSRRRGGSSRDDA